MSYWPHEFIIAYVAAIGAVIGSFLNVVIYRLPRGRSIVRPASACPQCDEPIRWFDNIPIVSWVLLLGRCRSCRGRISIRYPLVEATAAALTACAVVRYGLNLVGFEVVVFTWATLALGLIDLDHQLLPNVITYPMIALGLIVSFFGGFAPLLSSVLGAAVGAALPSAVIIAYRKIRGEDGMGWGDVKYLAAIGAVFGLVDCLWILIAAAVLGAVFGIALMASGRGSSQTALPFGTFLAIAVLLRFYVPIEWLAWSFL